MSTTQERIMDAIATGVRARDAVLVTDPQYGNTGTVYATDDGNMEPLGLVLSYDFQGHRATFRHHGNEAAAWSADDTAEREGRPRWCHRTVAELVEAVAIDLTGGTR